MRRWTLWAPAVSALLAAALVPLASGRATGALTLNATLPMLSTPGPCPPGAPDVFLCARRIGGDSVPGLGEVSESYFYFVEEAQDCATSSFHIGSTTARFSVEGKGAIELTLAPSLECYPSALVTTQAFSVTGSSGVYAGASGSGTVHHEASYTSSGGAAGKDIWAGTLSVPGLEFDLAPPAITGAVSKLVRAPRKAKRVRAKYKLTALDAVDGVVSVACEPKSGSRFRLGRTVVHCSATDRSANTQTARFTITVVRAHKSR